MIRIIKPPTPHEVVSEESRAAGQLASDVIGQRRMPELLDVRKKIAFRLKNRGMSYREIGQALGGRHRTSIMNIMGVLKDSKPHKRTTVTRRHRIIAEYGLGL